MAGAAGGSPHRKAAERVFGALRTSAGLPRKTGAALPPPEAGLDHAIAGACAVAGPSGPVAIAFRNFARELHWEGRKVDPELADLAGIANAMIAGPGGLEERDDVMVGVSLMAPDIRYPDHRHPPEEVYLALTPGEWWNADMPWTEPGPGGLIYNPPGILHAMRSGASPFLAIWCLPLQT